MDKQKFDCIVIGGGPGGYVAAIRAAQNGLKTALIEADQMGGTCLNRGCIPSKALIANADVWRKVNEADRFGISIQGCSFQYSSMVERKDKLVASIRKGLEGLIASNQIVVFKGFGKFLSSHEVKVMGVDDAILEGKNIIIATGSEPRSLAHMPFDYKKIHDSTSLLEMKELPKTLLIVGGGVIGSEFACLYHALGVEVTILEMLPHILPTEGKQMGELMQLSMKKRGIKIETSAQVQRLESDEKGVRALLGDGKTISAACALVSVGRKFNTDKIGLEKTGVLIEKDGSIKTNGKMQTNISHIYAVGDITAKWILAHVASHQGVVAADTMAGHLAHMDYAAVPSVVFTTPEIASVGYTLEKATSLGLEAITGKFPFQALGKSQAILEAEGFAQIVVEKGTGRLLGAQVMGYQASTLISEMTVAIANELTVDSIRDTIHAHPTLAEVWLEAAFVASGIPLHLPPARIKA